MKMTNPSLNVTRFSDKDVIATSGVSPIVGPHLILSNMGDVRPSNNTMKLIKDGESVEIIKSNYEGWPTMDILDDVVGKVRTNFNESRITMTTLFYYGSDPEDRTTIVGMFASLTDEHKADGQYQFNSSGGYFYKTN